MKTFGIRSHNKMPQSVDEPCAALDLLYWAVYACLRSHAKDIDSSVELEMGMYLSDNKLTMIVPHSCADVALKAAMECYILKQLKFKWAVGMDDEKFEKVLMEAAE